MTTRTTHPTDQTDQTHHRHMRWDCEVVGCFNKKHRVPLGVFDAALPGRVGMSDLDGVVTYFGHFLFLEWKSPGTQMPVGQRILIDKLLLHVPKTSVIIVSGDAATATVDRFRILSGRDVLGDEDEEWREGHLPALNCWISSWARRAESAYNA